MDGEFVAMDLKQYILKDEERVLSYIENFDLNDVILKDYYYYSGKSFFNTESLYSEKQIARILNITDKEYATLVDSYFSNSQKDTQVETAEVQNKIDALNLKLNKSREFEEATKKVKEVDGELEGINKDLSSISEVDRKLQDMEKESATYGDLSKFNLQKMHEDLVGINFQIDKIEEDLLNRKVVDIKEGRKKTVFDQGRIGLGIGIIIAFGIFGAIFWLLETPVFIPLILWGFGLIVGLFLIIFSRHEVELASVSSDSESYSYTDMEDLLKNLKAQRAGILSILKLKTANEFFLLKAKYSSLRKSLEYLKNQREELSKSINFEEINKKRTDLVKQQLELQDKLRDPSIQLKSDEYLQYYRELDALKLSLNQMKSSGTVSKDEVPQKLEAIRKELSDKLPSYLEILKNTFKRSFDKIITKSKDLVEKVGLAHFEINENLDNWDSLTDFQKFIIQYTLTQEIYSQNYSFIVEEVGKWPVEEKTNLKVFIDSVSGEGGNEIVSVDYEKNW